MRGRAAFSAPAQGDLIGPDDWIGEVLTVHSRAVNILRTDGLIVSLVADLDFMTAMSVCVPRLFGAPPGETSVGRPVTRKGRWIEIDMAARVDLAGSRPWKGTIEAALLREIPPARIAEVHESLLVHGRADGLLGIFLPEKSTQPLVEKAKKALQAGRMEGLVGLGPGLTPAGDDFLVGTLLAFPGATWGASLDAALPGTTPAGRTLLWLGLRRSFPAYLVAFVNSIARSDSAEATDKAVRAACAHGETSGSDALAGFCWARLHFFGHPGSHSFSSSGVTRHTSPGRPAGRA